MARPRKKTDDVRGETVRTRLTLAERVFLEEQAEAAGMTLSDYQRARLLDQQITPQSDRQVIARFIVELNRLGNNFNQGMHAIHCGKDFTQYCRIVGDEIRELITRASKVIG